MRESDDIGSDWASRPGETILDILEERGWTQEYLAERMGITKEGLSHIIEGTAAITGQVALELAQVLGSSALFWLNREAQYWEDSERLAASGSRTKE